MKQILLVKVRETEKQEKKCDTDIQGQGEGQDGCYCSRFPQVCGMLHHISVLIFEHSLINTNKVIIYFGLYASMVISTRAPISLGEKQDRC